MPTPWAEGEVGSSKDELSSDTHTHTQMVNSLKIFKGRNAKKKKKKKPQKKKKKKKTPNPKKE